MEQDKQELKHRILIVDDERVNRTLIADLLKDHYKIIMAKDGEQALKRVFCDTPPDLVLLDIMMPDIDGYEVCRQIMANDRTKDIPIIFISSKTEAGDEAGGLEIGAIDYITKPVSPPILKARVKNHLRLSDAMRELKLLYSMALDANPITGLPGNNSISSIIDTALENRSDFTIIYTDLDNFKAFNDKYGFARGDQVILFTKNIMFESLKVEGLQDGFIGHVGGDDFVLAIPKIDCEKLTNRIITMFDEGICRYYDESDREAGYISSKNRQGENMNFPLMTISMAGIHLLESPYQKHLEVVDAMAGLKKKAKDIPGSVFYVDSRKGL